MGRPILFYHGRKSFQAEQIMPRLGQLSVSAWTPDQWAGKVPFQRVIIAYWETGVNPQFYLNMQAGKLFLHESEWKISVLAWHLCMKNVFFLICENSLWYNENISFMYYDNFVYMSQNFDTMKTLFMYHDNFV